jgi:hypothetical protein
MLATWAKDGLALEAGVQLAVHIFQILSSSEKDTPRHYIEQKQHALVHLLEEAPAISGILWNLFHGHLTHNDMSPQREAFILEWILPCIHFWVMAPNFVMNDNQILVPKRYEISNNTILRTLTEICALRTGSVQLQAHICSNLVKWCLILSSTTVEPNPERAYFLSHLVSLRKDMSEDWKIVLFSLVCLDLAERCNAQQDVEATVGQLVSVCRECTSHDIDLIPPWLLFIPISSALLQGVLSMTSLTQLLQTVGDYLEQDFIHEVALSLLIPCLHLVLHADSTVRDLARRIILQLDQAAFINEVATRSEWQQKMPHLNQFMSLGAIAELQTESFASLKLLPHRILFAPRMFRGNGIAFMKYLDKVPRHDLAQHAYSLYLYFMYEVTRSSPLHIQHIIHKGLPILVRTREAAVVSKIVKQLVGWVKDFRRVPALAISAVSGLFHAWNSWPRIFPHFRSAISYYLSTEMAVRSHPSFTRQLAEDEMALETTIALNLSKAVQFRPQDMREYVIVFLDKLISFPGLQGSTLKFVVIALKHAVDATLCDPTAAWEVLLKKLCSNALRCASNPTTLELDICEELMSYVPYIATPVRRSEAIETLIYPFLPFSLALDHIETSSEGIEIPVFKPKVNAPSSSIISRAMKVMTLLSMEEMDRFIPDSLIDVSNILFEYVESDDQELSSAATLVLQWMIDYEVRLISRGLFFGNEAELAEDPRETPHTTTVSLSDIQKDVSLLCLKSSSVITNASLGMYLNVDLDQVFI